VHDDAGVEKREATMTTSVHAGQFPLLAQHADGVSVAHRAAGGVGNQQVRGRSRPQTSQNRRTGTGGPPTAKRARGFWFVRAGRSGTLARPIVRFVIRVSPKSSVTPSTELLASVRGVCGGLANVGVVARSKSRVLARARCAVGATSAAAAAQFSPSGRKKHSASTSEPRRTSELWVTSGLRIASDSVSGSISGARQARARSPRGRRGQRLIERYTAIVMAQPSAPFPSSGSRSSIDARRQSRPADRKSSSSELRRASGCHRRPRRIYRSGRPERARASFEKAIAVIPER